MTKNDFILKLRQKTNKENIIDIGTGYKEIDRITGDLKEKMVAIQGRKGKDFLLNVFFNHLLQKDKKVLFLANNLTEMELYSIVASMLTGIPYRKIKSGFLTEEEFENIKNKMSTEIKDFDFFRNRDSGNVFELANRADIIFIENVEALYSKSNLPALFEIKRAVAELGRTIFLFSSQKSPLFDTVINVESPVKIDGNIFPGLDIIFSSETLRARLKEEF